MRRRVGRERERERGRGKVWEWSRSGRREDEDANRAADPRGREGRVESGLPQQQQQTKKIRRGGSWYWGTLGRSPVRPSDLRVGGLPRHPKNVVQLLVPHGEPPFRTLSLSLSLSLSPLASRQILSPLSSPISSFLDLEFEEIKHASRAATAFVWLASQRCSRRPWRARRRGW